MALIRKLERYSRVKPSIGFYSHKNRKMLYCESRLERSRLYQLEFDDSVASYTTQPTTFEYSVGRNKRVYTPDLLIKRTDSTFQFEEIKPDKEFEKPKMIEKFQRLTEIFGTQIGVPLELNPSSNIRVGSNLVNFMKLYRARQQVLPHKEFDLFQAELSCERLTVCELFSWSKEASGESSTALRFLAYKLFDFDITKLITPLTILEVKK